jgi:hypothetical protein
MLYTSPFWWFRRDCLFVEMKMEAPMEHTPGATIHAVGTAYEKLPYSDRLNVSALGPSPLSYGPDARVAGRGHYSEEN